MITGSDFNGMCDSTPEAIEPIANYRFDECEYTGAAFEVVDQTGNYAATTFSGFNTSEQGQIERFADLSDKDHHIETSIPLPSSFTVSAWFKKPTSNSGSPYFVLGAMQSGGDLLYVDRTNNWRWGVYNPSTGSQDGDFSFASLDNNWHHLALVYSGGQTQLYIDGSLEDSVNRAPTGTLKYIGTSFDGVTGSNAQGFRAALDEFMVFDSALSGSAIQTFYDNQNAQKNYDGSDRDTVNCLIPSTEYRFDETEYSETADEIVDSIGGFHGLAKDSQPTEGKVCNAIDLSASGTTNYAILDENILTGKTDFSISLWAKTSKTSNQSILSGAGASTNELIMWFTSHTRFLPYLKGSQNGTITTDSIADNNWHHIVWTRQGSQSCLFVDKVLQGCVTQTTLPLSIQSLILGQEQDSVGGRFSSSQAFDGLIDEFLIFEQAISVADIATIYDNQDAGLGYDGSTRDCPISVIPPPILDIQFDETNWTDANSVIDSSGNNYHANAVNATPTEGLICRAADFTSAGINDYITLDSNTLHNRNNFTISLWYKTPKTGPQSLISAGNSSQLNELIFWFTNDTRFSPHIKGGSQSITTNTVAGDVWHHLVWTRSGSNNLFYRDGVLQAGTATLSGGALNITSLILGQEQDSLGGGFDSSQAVEGLIDELLVFDKALSSTDVHEIFTNQNNGLNYDGTSRADCQPLLDHFEIEHDGQGLTCEAESITIKACANASCSTLNTDTVDVGLSINGTFHKTVTVSGGSTITTFPFTSPGTATLSLDQTFECENGASTSCDVVFSDTGFRFFSNVEGTSIPTQLSGKPSNLGFEASTLKVQAIEKNPDTGACQASFINTTAIEMAATCVDPVACASSQVAINNLSTTSNISTLDNADTLSYSSVELDFSDNTVNSAEFVFTYPDAGKVQLHARYNIPDENGDPSGNYMLGSSNTFVVRPFGFYVEVSDNPKAQTAAGDKFIAAGEDFKTTLTAIQWQAADDSIDNNGNPDDGADLSDNAATLNFGKEVSPETALIEQAIVLPNPGALGDLTNSNFSGFDDGKATVADMTYDEVGIISFSANLTDNSYLGVEDVVGSEPYVGRFIPHHFELTPIVEGELKSVCDITIPSSEMGFAYSGQMSSSSSGKGALQYDLLPEVTITPQAKGGSHTQNYTGNFNKLILSGITRFQVDDGTGTLVDAPIEDAERKGVDDINKVKLTANFFDASLTESSAVLSFEYSALDNFIYTHEQNSEIIPFTSDIKLRLASVIDEDGVTANDADGDPDGAGAIVEADTVITLNPTGKEIRFGRAYLE
ncbi:MAG: LamG domain-containing protein, partial [Colwellia sp.]|nr:LamG domain-containing protein [Colwellia sp.]